MSMVRISALAIGVALAATPAFAQSYGTPSGSMQNTPSTQNQGMQGMQGTHEMPATVTSVDKATGMISVKAEGKNLRLHFPPSALTNIKTGDRIKVQLGLMKT